MSILSLFEDTGDLADLDPVETVTRQLTPPHLRRPLAAPPGKRAVVRASFAGVSDSGELPLLGIERPRPDETARIIVTRPAKQRRPWFFRGTRRLDRHRAALLAARGGEGGSL